MKKYLFFAISLFSLFIVNVKCAVLPSSSFDLTLFDSSLPVVQVLSSNASIKGHIFLNNFSMKEDYSYLLFDVCSTSYLSSSNFIISNTGYTAYFLEESVKVYRLNDSCSVSGYEGIHHRVQIQVGGYTDSGGDGLNASSYLTIKNTDSYNSFWRFYSPQLSSVDVLTPLIESGISIEKQQEMIDQQKETNKKLDDVNKNQQDTNKKLDDVKGAITSEDNPNLEGLNNSAGWLPNGPLDSILNLPLSLLENLSTNLSKTCQPVILPLPYVDKTVELPCVSTIYSKIEGLDTWLNTIGIIASAFILFSYLVFIEKWADATLTLRENTQQDWGGI